MGAASQTKQQQQQQQRQKARSPSAPPVVLLLGGAVLAIAGLFFGLRRKRTSQPEAADLDRAPAPVSLTWRGVSCNLKGKKGSEKLILDNLSGAALPGRLLVLMGPSGSGKTSLLNAIAGALPRQSGLRLSGDVRLNGVVPPRSLPRGSVQGYVTQDDALFTQLTAEETLELAAELRLPAALSAESKRAAAARLLTQLGLARVAHTRVASLSGGERKRLCIAVELLAGPSLLVLDECTSGLDAFAAQSVVQALSALARRGHTVLTSLHQPRGSIFKLCDDLVLLAEGGRPLYVGPASGSVAYFERMLATRKPDVSDAEWLSDLAAVDTSSSEAEAESRARVDKLAALWRGAEQAQAQPPPGEVALAAPRGSTLGWGRQFVLLFGRAWKQVMRDKATMIGKLGSTISSALIFAAIYWKLGRSQAAVQSRAGLLQVAAVNCAMSSLVKMLTVFPTERALVSRERAAGAYDVAPYFAAKLAAELPVGAIFPALFGALLYPAAGLQQGAGRIARFLGILTLESFSSSAFGMVVSALVPSTKAALAAGPALMVINIVFGGQFTSEETIPPFLRFLPRVSLIKQAFEALAVNEFRGLSFDAPLPGDTATGEVALRRLGFEQSTVHAALRAQSLILLGEWGLTYLVLLRRKPRFAPMEECKAEDEGKAT